MKQRFFVFIGQIQYDKDRFVFFFFEKKKSFKGRKPVPARRPAAVSISCSVCRVRMTCLQDLLYLSSTVRTRTPPPCPLYPVKPQSSGTLRCAGSNASRTSASETEKSASTATGTVRYSEGGAPGGPLAAPAPEHTLFSICLSIPGRTQALPERP